ncbi:pyridoxal-phosphate dependent enzyme [Erwinia aphidicola]
MPFWSRGYAPEYRYPLIESLPLSQLANTRIWLKMEALQPSGSFKMRGIGYVCEQHYARGAKRFITSSGGNAGLAVAYAGRRLGVPTVVVVPETTTERAKHLLSIEGAEVIVHGSMWSEANERAQSLRGNDDVFIHPFDDPLLWQGHASMIDEVLALLYGKKIPAAGLKNVLVIVCGGSTTTVDALKNFAG